MPRPGVIGTGAYSPPPALAKPHVLRSLGTTMSYCASRFHTVRRSTVEVMIGAVGVGGTHPVRLQSMTTSDTQDITATVRQSIALAEAGCEIVRITAPNVAAAQCLREIRAKFSAAGASDLAGDVAGSVAARSAFTSRTMRRTSNTLT